MIHANRRIWVHAVWSTKCREPLIHQDIEKEIYLMIRNKFIETGCSVRIINGTPDHVHCLFCLSIDKTIIDVMHKVKGATSYYINLKKLTTFKFAWQKGYGAFPVSLTDLEKIYEYIKNQKEHHRDNSYIDIY